MSNETQKKMHDYAQTLPPSSARAQCYTIANYLLNDEETIAQRLDRDHRSSTGALRAAKLMVYAGCAEEVLTKHQEERSLFGKFIFEDESELA